MVNPFEKLTLDNVGQVTDAFGENAVPKIEELKTQKAEETLALAGLIIALKEAGQNELAQEIIGNEDVSEYFELIKTKIDLEQKKHDSKDLATQYVSVNEKILLLAPKVKALLEKANEAVS